MDTNTTDLTDLTEARNAVIDTLALVNDDDASSVVAHDEALARLRGLLA